MNKQGFTLIETLMTIGIFAIAIAIIGGFVIYSYRSINLSFGKALVIDNARKVVNSCSHELREARQSDDGAYLLASADDFEIIFYSDIDTDSGVEKIRYFLESGKLKKEITNPTGNPAVYGSPETAETISSYVANDPDEPLFFFYDQNYQGQEDDLPLTTPVSAEDLTSVRLVGTRVIIDADTQNSDILIIETKTRLRNVN